MAALANEAARSENKARFEMDLEFVQSLGNTQYLYQLAHQGILDDAAFVNYLKYLLYFCTPKFSQFVHYPQSLHILTLLQEPSFRTAMKNEGMAAEVSKRMMTHYQTWRAGPAPVAEEAVPVPNVT